LVGQSIGEVPIFVVGREVEKRQDGNGRRGYRSARGHFGRNADSAGPPPGLQFRLDGVNTRLSAAWHPPNREPPGALPALEGPDITVQIPGHLFPGVKDLY